MTPTLAAGLLMGPAPPADVSPGIPTTGPSSTPASTAKSPTKTEGESPQESFATVLECATQGAAEQGGGETAALPQGSTPPPEATPDVAELLARFAALAQGVADEGERTGPTESTETNLLLDRLAEAGGPETDTDGAKDFDVRGAAEALMAYLVMRQQMPVDPDAMSAVPDDLVSLLQQIEGVSSGAATDLELVAQQAVQAAVALTSTDPVVADRTVEALDLRDAVPPEVVDVTDVPTAAVAGASDVPADSTDAVLVAPPAPSAAGRAAPATPVAAEPAVVERPGEVASATPATSAAVATAEMAMAGVDPGESDTPSADASVSPVDVSGTPDRRADVAAAMTAQPPVQGPAVETVNATRVVNAATLPAEVADTVRTAVFHGDSDVRLVLNPPDLGHLDIHISRGEHGLRIVLEASQSGARELLDRSITGLHQALEARDLRVDRLEVRATDTGRGSLDTSAGGQQSGGGAFNGSQGQDTPEWSPVAMFDAINNEAVGVSQPEQTTGRDASGVAGSVDVLA